MGARQYAAYGGGPHVTIFSRQAAARRSTVLRVPEARGLFQRKLFRAAPQSVHAGRSGAERKFWRRELKPGNWDGLMSGDVGTCAALRVMSSPGQTSAQWWMVILPVARGGRRAGCFHV